MKYMWSKNRIAKYLLPIILKDRKPNQWYVEPFVWGANMIDKVGSNRIGWDINKYLISLFNSLQKGWLPPKEITKEQYQHIKENKDNYADELVAYVGFQLSYWARFFNSYRRDNEWKRNYALEAYNNTGRQIENIKWIKFIHSSYQELEIPKNSIIYCDIPYDVKNIYLGNDKFNHIEFWDWCREKKEEWHTIFISEYNAPSDFKCVWEKEHKTSFNWKGKWWQKSVEKLFTI